MASRTGRTLLTRGLAVAAASVTARSGGSALAAATSGAPAARSASALLTPAGGNTGSLLPAAARAMASESQGEAVTYAGLTLHKPAAWQKTAGSVMAGIMWFWIFVRLYHDWDVLIFGPEIHLKHELDEDDH